MDILCLTHADFETPGVIETWAHENSHSFTICRPYRGEPPFAQQNFDCLIFMGGPQSPLELEKDPYLKDEIQLIQKAIQDDKLILGFCLGAQLIGEALGAKTERSPEKEIGVYPITLTEEGLCDPLLQGLPVQFPVIHWHNDMPGETKDSVILARSEGCPRQILRYGSKAYGFQCHLEITPDGIEDMIRACPNDLAPGRFTQDAATLRKQDYVTINKMMICLLDRFVALNEEIRTHAKAFSAY